MKPFASMDLLTKQAPFLGTPVREKIAFDFKNKWPPASKINAGRRTML